MGCSGSKRNEMPPMVTPDTDAEAPTTSTAKVNFVVDPRWDVEGFNRWAEACQLAWVQVGYLRELHVSNRKLPYRQVAARGSLWVGAPPSEPQLYFVGPFTWLGDKKSRAEGAWNRMPEQDEWLHPDPEGFILGKIVSSLDQDGAYDDDLLCIYSTAAFCFTPSLGDEQRFEVYQNGSLYLQAFHRIKCISVPEVPSGFAGQPVMERMWGLHEFNLSAYCQRIVNSNEDHVKEFLTPEKLLSGRQQILGAPCIEENDRISLLAMRKAAFGLMKSACDDALGFGVVCEQARWRWVRVSFIQSLAVRGGPPPRCQDLPYGTFIDGRVPAGARHFVVSHAWSAHLHFSPSGGKMTLLMSVLNSLGAADDDVVFIDFMSLNQAGGWVPKAYLEYNVAARRQCVARTDASGRLTDASGEEFVEGNGRQHVEGGITIGAHMVKLKGRSEAQERRFRFALFETTRLYAYRPPTGPSVIVLPEIEPPESFPGVVGEVPWEQNTVCVPPRQEKRTAWGFSKSIAYQDSGWPCAEYAVSRMNGTIANANDEAVQKVEGARKWPTDVEAYARLMDENALKKHGIESVTFTKGGDREAVRFNFYKYSYRIDE